MGPTAVPTVLLPTVLTSWIAVLATSAPRAVRLAVYAVLPSRKKIYCGRQEARDSHVRRWQVLFKDIYRIRSAFRVLSPLCACVAGRGPMLPG